MDSLKACTALIKACMHCKLLPAYQSQCTISRDESFTGDDNTYLCNITSDHNHTMVDWVSIGGVDVDVMCERSLL